MKIDNIRKQLSSLSLDTTGKKIDLVKEDVDKNEEMDTEDENIKGMYLSEAQDLLESLRGKERLLPYTETSPSKQRDGRDW